MKYSPNAYKEFPAEIFEHNEVSALRSAHKYGS